MSDMVKSRGYIAVLEKEIDHEAMWEKLWADKSTLSISYDGKLVYSDIYSQSKEKYTIDGLFIGSHDTESDFERLYDELSKYGLDIVRGSQREYTCIWYNGCYSPMSSMTKEEFLKSAAENL